MSLDTRINEAFPFNWFPQRVGRKTRYKDADVAPLRFHSIGFPSEWGVGSHALSRYTSGFVVSIQLVSPASGEKNLYSISNIFLPSLVVSIQLVSPASGEVVARWPERSGD